VKDQSAILVRARELVNSELERRLANAQLRLPHQCIYNHRQPLDVNKTVEGEANPTYNRVSPEGVKTIGLCMFGQDDLEEWPGTICEDPIDAQRCPLYVTTLTQEKVLESFREDLTNPEWVAANMPELAALLWVLEDSSLPQLPWFRRFLLNFRRFRVEPLRPAVDPANLLPGGP
jgi:hypothetical protein